MEKKKIISNLIIINLIAIFFILINRFKVIHNFINVVVWIIVTPIVFGVFLFYILKPLNEIFIKKGIKRSRASSLTLIIIGFFLAGIIKYFGEYFIKQVIQLKEVITLMIEDGNTISMVRGYAENDNIKSVLGNLTSQVSGCINYLIFNLKDIFDKGMMIFSNIFLVILITFFLLKDGNQFKEVILKYCPGKYKDIMSETLSEGDEILSTYIRGQAIVALSLAVMVFIGYAIIGMPSALLLAFTTFILAFIPFVGFFVSMIIPYIIATIVGANMILKLSILFVVAQTLKGRVVVPFIMGKAMKIHPITDIFLVVGAAAIGGPIAAFSIIPIYSLLKLAFKKFQEGGYISFRGRKNNVSNE